MIEIIQMISFSITQDVVLTDLNDDFPIALNGSGLASKFDRPKRVPLELDWDAMEA